MFTPGSTPQSLTAKQLPGVPGHVPALLVRGLLSREDCQSILSTLPWDGPGYMSLEDVVARYRGRVSHRYLSYDQAMSQPVFTWLAPLLPQTLDGGSLAEISPEWRVLKYETGGQFTPHVDRREPGDPDPEQGGHSPEGVPRFLQSRLT